jgi:putative lipoprotein
MKKIWLSLVAGWLAMLIGCSERNQEIEMSDIKQTLVGEAYYSERKLLPSGAELHLTLEDVSKMDVPSSVIATATQVLTGAPPYEFKLGYFEADVYLRMQYNLRATIMLDGELLFTSTEQLNPFREPEKDIVIMLSMVSVTNEQLPTVTSHDADTGLAVVSVDPRATTRAACVAGMDTESDFLQVSDVTAYYSIHKETLTLLNDQRQPVARFKAMYFN